MANNSAELLQRNRYGVTGWVWPRCKVCGESGWDLVPVRAGVAGVIVRVPACRNCGDVADIPLASSLRQPGVLRA